MEALNLLNKTITIEENELGSRPERMVDLFALVCTIYDEVSFSSLLLNVKLCKLIRYVEKFSFKIQGNLLKYALQIDHVFLTSLSFYDIRKQKAV